MDKRLIINGDDFGRTVSVTDAIMDCHRQGILTSTTLMTQMPATEYACQRAKEAEGLGVGIHLTLTQGPALSKMDEVRDLVDEQGVFLHPLKQNADLRHPSKDVGRQIEREFAAQVERALDLGIQPTHCDSHAGIHSLPIVRDAIINVVRRYGIIKVRNQISRFWCPRGAGFRAGLQCFRRNLSVMHKTAFRHWSNFLYRRAGFRLTDRKISLWQMMAVTSDPVQRMLICLEHVPEGVSEILFHPDYSPSDSAQDDGKNEDTRILTDARVIEAVKRNNIQLISYADL